MGLRGHIFQPGGLIKEKQDGMERKQGWRGLLAKELGHHAGVHFLCYHVGVPFDRDWSEGMLMGLGVRVLNMADGVQVLNGVVACQID